MVGSRRKICYNKKNLWFSIFVLLHFLNSYSKPSSRENKRSKYYSSLEEFGTVHKISTKYKNQIYYLRKLLQSSRRFHNAFISAFTSFERLDFLRISLCFDRNQSVPIELQRRRARQDYEQVPTIIERAKIKGRFDHKAKCRRLHFMLIDL